MLKNLGQHLRAAWASRRWRRALLIAAISDVIGFGVGLWPPAQWMLDAITAAALFAALGFRWQLLTALVVEAIPGLATFPAWILVVAALAAADVKPEKAVPAAEK